MSHRIRGMNCNVLLVVVFLLLPATLAGQGSNDARTVVQSADADYYCTFEIPDSLGLNALGTDVEPNPFRIRYSMKNQGTSAGTIRKVMLYLPPGEGLSLNPASPMTLDSTMTLLVGVDETVLFEWLVDVEKWETRRNSRIQVIAYDGEGDPFPCDDRLPIVAITITGIENPVVAEPNFTVYPNPSSGHIVVDVHATDMHPSSLLLTDVLGRELQRIRIDRNTNSYGIDLSAHQSGVYFLHLRSGIMSMWKVVVKR